MQLIFLGTGGYHPNERRQTAGVLLPEIGLLLDAGSGLYRLSERLRSDDLTIVLSHAHLDHVCGLTYLLVPQHLGRIRRLRVLGATEVLDTVRKHLFAERLFPVLPEAEFVPLVDGDSITIDDGVVLNHQPLSSHPGGSRGYRLDWTEAGLQKSLAYITDTTVDGSYTEFVRGVDLLIHECYFPDDAAEWAEKSGHSHTTMVAQLALDAGVGRLLLTHIDPQRPGDDPIGLETARADFSTTEIAEDLMQVVV